MPLKEISIEDIYQNDRKLKKEDVLALLDWVKKQPHLPLATELQIILFLHSSYYSIEAAKNTTENYFTVRTLCPDLFGSRTFQDNLLKVGADCLLATTLPKQTPSGDTVMILRIMDGNLSKFNGIAQLKLMDVAMLLHLHENGPMNGLQVIFDMQLSTFGHILKVNPIVVKKFLYYLQEGMPIRLKRVHFINILPFLDKLFALIKPFMKKELFDSFVIHSDINSLYQYVPKAILPEDYGGNCDSSSVLQEKVKQQISDSEDFLKFQENQLVDESKRQGASKFAEDLFGVQGSFKKLEID